MSSSVEQDIDSMKKYSNKRGISRPNHPMIYLRKTKKLMSFGFQCKALRCLRTSCGDVVKTIQAVLDSNFARFSHILASSSPVVPSFK